MLKNEQELKTVEQKIEDAHQKLIGINFEHDRIKKFHQSEKSAIEQIQPIKTDLEKSVLGLTASKKTLSDEIVNLESEKASLNQDIAKLRDEFVSLNKQIETETASHKERTGVVIEAEKNLDLHRNSLFAREETIAETEILVNEKYLKLKEFINSI